MRASDGPSTSDGSVRASNRFAVFRRLSLVAVDQAISGASNVLIAVLAARVLGVASFGYFGIVFVVFTLVQGVSRALVCDPLLVHAGELAKRRGEAIGTSCALGFGLATLLAVFALAVRAKQPELGEALLVLAPFLPLLMLQDLGRYLGVASQRPGKSVTLDAAWLLIVTAAVTALLIEHVHTLAWFIAVWAGSGAAAGLLVFWQQRGARLAVGLDWIRHTWQFSWRYLISYTSTQTSLLGASSAVAGIAGARALGAVQGTVLLARPFGTLQIAAVVGGAAEIARTGVSGRAVRKRIIGISTVASIVALVNAVIMLVLPDSLGVIVLGKTWHATKPLLLPTAVQLLCLGLITGPRAGLVGMRAPRRTMVIDMLNGALFLAAAVLGAAFDGARGALWAIALTQALLVSVWWIVCWRHTASSTVLLNDRAHGEQVAVVAIDLSPTALSGTGTVLTHLVEQAGDVSARASSRPPNRAYQHPLR